MRRAILVVFLIASPGMAQVQVGTPYRPGEDQLYPSYSGHLSFRPNYAYDGGLVWGSPRTATTGNEWRVYSWNEQPKLRGPGSFNRPAGYFYYPHYPGLSYSNPPDIRPDVYELPPPPLTPYHDPYFEERIWHDLDDYEYWGW
jgi:hypothetical protein